MTEFKRCCKSNNGLVEISNARGVCFSPMRKKEDEKNEYKNLTSRFWEVCMRSFKMLLFLVLALVFSINIAQATKYSYQYVENFGSGFTAITNNGWIPNTFRGKSGIFRMATNNLNWDNDPNSPPWNGGGTPSRQTVGTANGVSDSSLIIYGRGNNANLIYNNYWTGNGIKFAPYRNSQIGTNIVATPENPFGFTVVRRMGRIDNLSDARGQSLYHQSALNIFLAEENYKTNEWENYDNFIVLYEEMVSGNATTSGWGIWRGGKYPINLAGPFYDTWGNSSGSLSYLSTNMQDGSSSILNMNFYGGNRGTLNANTRVVGIKMVHDGSKVYIYLNPQPYANTGSWYKVAETSVVWYSNLVVEFGNDSLIFISESQEGYYDNFTIRTVTSNSVAYIGPSEVIKSSTNIYTITISNTITVLDSGVGEVKITKPAGFGAWDTNAVWVENYFITGNNTNNRIFSGEPAQNQFLVRRDPFDPNSLLIRFRMVSPYGVITNGLANTTIKVSFRLVAPSSGGNYTFSAYVGCDKYPGTDVNLRYATVGWKKVSPVGGGLTVRVYDSPFVYAGLTYNPSTMYEGNDVYQMIYSFSTRNLQNRPDIGVIEIAIPNGFVVSNAFYSEILKALSTNRIYLTNYNGTNRIRVDYAAGGMIFPGVDGIDEVTFYVVQTPDLPVGIKVSNFTWPVFAYDKFGNRVFFAGTNTNNFYPNQTTRVLIPSPDAVASIYPNKIGNEKKTNTFTYTVVNAGPSGNDIFRMFIWFDTTYLSSTAFGLSNSGTVNGSAPARLYTTNIAGLGFGVFVEYTNSSKPLRSSSNDIIYFTAIHTRANVDDPPVSVDFMVYADNLNTEGLVIGSENSPNSWRVSIVPPEPEGVAYIYTNRIDTTTVYFTITNYLYNTGASGNNIMVGRIRVPDGFRVMNAQSHLIVNDGANVVISGQDVWLKYKDDNGIGLRSVYDGVFDYIVLTLSNTNYFTPTSVVFSNFVSNNRGETNCLDKSPSEVQTMFVEWPYLSAWISMRPTNTYPDIPANTIDASSYTNTVEVIISNTGLVTGSSNIIYQARIYVDPIISTNILNIKSSIIDNDSLYTRFISGGNYILLDYLGDGKKLLPNQRDIIYFDMVDLVEDTRLSVFNSQASNQRGYQQITNGNSSIQFIAPHAYGAGKFERNIIYTTSFSTNQTIVLSISNAGKGSNKLRKVKVNFPSIYQSRILLVQSSIIGTSVTLTPNYVIVDYSAFNTNLPAGYVDNLQMMFSNTFFTPTEGLFTLEVDNGFYGFEAGTNAIYSHWTNDLSLKISEQPSFAIAPTNISTFTNTNVITISLSNGVNSGSKDINRLRITIPNLFIIDDVQNSTPTSLSVLPGISYANNTIVLNFSGEKFGGGDYHTVTVRVIDSFDYGETNVYWVVDADYGDGYLGNNFGYSARGISNLFIKLDPANANAKITPNDVYYDVSATPMSVAITNRGHQLNKIYWANIFLPSVYTNVVILSNNIPASITYTSSNTIFVNYQISNTNLPAGREDIVYFVAYDNQTLPGYSTNITVRVANYPSNIYFVNATERVLGDLSNKFVVPPYRVTYRVEPESVSAFENTFIQYKIYLNNTGDPGNDVEELDIYFPSLLLTNGMTVSSSFGSPSVSIFSNRVYLNFSSTPINSGNSAIITISARDSWVFGNTNVYFFVKSKFNTSLGQFVDGHVSGGTNMVRFISDPPYAVAKLINTEFYKDNKSPVIKMVVSNVGVGDNNVTALIITVPAELRIGFDETKVSSLKATNITYSSGVVYLFYTNFVVNSTDLITFSFSNTNESGFFYFTGRASNFIFDNDILYANPDDVKLSIISVPNAEVLTKELDTLRRTNTFILKVNNSIAGNSPVKDVKVTFRNPITNIIFVSNSYPASVSVNDNTNVLISYTGQGIPKGGNDIIALDVVDEFEFGDTNLSVFVEVSEGVGFVQAWEGYNGTNFSIKMPRAQGYAYLVTRVLLISDDPSVPAATNSFRMVMTNTGSDFNNVRFVKIELPSEITNIWNIQVSYPAIVSNSSNLVFIHYTSDGIPSQGFDEISMEFENYYTSKQDKKRVKVWYDNGVNDLQYIDPPAGKSLDLTFDFPETPPDYYIVRDTDVAYTIDTNHTIVMRLVNNSYSYPISKLYVNYNPADFIVLNVSMSNVSYFISWNTNQTNIVIDMNLPTRRADYIIVNILYNKSSGVTNDMSAKILYLDGEKLENVNTSSTETDKFKIHFANFGRVLGLVKPYSKDVSVRIVYPNTETVVIDNIKSNNILSSLTVVSNDVVDIGGYRLDFIPPGTYDIIITGNKFRKYVIKNVSVVANTITNIGIVVLSNAPFSTEAREEQSVVSVYDGKTALVVPPGSLLNDFSVDIIVRDATDQEREGVSRSKGAGEFNNVGSMKVYELIMKTIPGVDIFENPLKSDVVLKFYYDESYISSQGWSEDSLSVWYWKDTTKEWIRLGGKIDKENNFIWIKTRYLHRVYTIMGDGDVSKEGVVRNVRVSPNPFTPIANNQSTDYKYGLLKITFDLDKPYSKYFVKIYDVNGKLMRVLEGDGSFGQGEVYWDGRDMDGVMVRNGAYFFVVIADNVAAYKGSIVLVK